MGLRIETTQKGLVFVNNCNEPEKLKVMVHPSCVPWIRTPGSESEDNEEDIPEISSDTPEILENKVLDIPTEIENGTHNLKSW